MSTNAHVYIVDCREYNLFKYGVEIMVTGVLVHRRYQSSDH